MFDWNFNIDLNWLIRLGEQPYYVIFWHFLVNGGWTLFVATFLYGAWINFVYRNQRKFAATQSYVFLAVDIPRNNLQTPRAVENIFASLAGAHTPLDWHEKKFKGMFQVGFSFEIISLDGYVQFIIRTPVQFRSLVEATLYSQYPEAEITEVSDYTADVTATFPNDEYNLWGADLIPAKPSYYPIRTYKDFQEILDNEFKDPMAAFLEIMNKIGPGEQIWFQILVSPADNDWMIEGKKAIDKILGVQPKVTESLLGGIAKVPITLLGEIADHILGTGVAATPAKPESKFNMMMMTPQQKLDVEAIMNKIDKINFNCKVRLIYFGKREVFKKGLAVSGIVGAIKQFSSTSLNALKPGGNKTQAKLFLKDLRLADMQNSILKNYKARNPDTCKGSHILSVEELATIWHFPYIEVRAPLVKKVEAKRASAPVGLPVEDIGLPIEESSPKEQKGKPELVPAADYDNDYFEARFAKDKTMETDRLRKAEILKELKDKEASAPVAPKKMLLRDYKYKEEEIVSAHDQFDRYNRQLSGEAEPEVVEKVQDENFKKDDDDAPPNLPLV